jgi:hypothetical protein
MIKYFLFMIVLYFSSFVSASEPNIVWRFDTRDPVVDEIFEQGFRARDGAENDSLYHHVAENNPTRESPQEHSVYIATTSNRALAIDQFELIEGRPGSNVSRGWIYRIYTDQSFFETDRSIRNAIDSGQLNEIRTNLLRRISPFYGQDDSSSEGSVFDEDEYVAYNPGVGIPYVLIESAQEIYMDENDTVQFGETVANPFFDEDYADGVNPSPLPPELMFNDRFPPRNPRGQINVLPGIGTFGMNNAGYCSSYQSSSKFRYISDFCSNLQMIPFTFPYD